MRFQRGKEKSFEATTPVGFGMALGVIEEKIVAYWAEQDIDPDEILILDASVAMCPIIVPGAGPRYSVIKTIIYTES